MGVATFVDPPDSFDEALRLSDELMYSVKRGAKDGLAQQTFSYLVASPPVLPPSSRNSDQNA